MKQNESTSVPPPYEDRDCHRPEARYVVRTQEPKRALKHHAVFVGDLEAALREANICAAKRSGFFHRRYERVEVWEGAGHDRLIASWFLGKVTMARAAVA